MAEEHLGRFIDEYKQNARPRRAAQVSPMLEAAWARHRYHDEFVCEQMAFFDQVLADFVSRR